MKGYEEIALLEKNIFRAKEQAHFLRCTLESVDVAIKHSKEQLDKDIEAYNNRASADSEVLKMHEKNIAQWSAKLDKLYGKQLKSIEKEKVEVVIEKTEKQVRKDVLKAKKLSLVEELKKAKEQIAKIRKEEEESE